MGNSLEELIKQPKELYLLSMVSLLNRRGDTLPGGLKEILNDEECDDRLEKIMGYVNGVLKKVNIPLMDKFRELSSLYDDEIFFPLHFQGCGTLITYKDMENIRVCGKCNSFFLITKQRKKKNLCNPCRKEARKNAVRSANRKHQGKKFIHAKEMEKEFFDKMGFHDPEFDPDFKEKFVTYTNFKNWYGLSNREAKKRFKERYLERYLNSKFKEKKVRDRMRRALKYELKWDLE